MIRDFEKSDFTFTTGEEFSNIIDNEVVSVIKKYKIITTEDKLLDCNENNYLSIMNYLEELYYLKKDIPDDLKHIIKYNVYYNNYLIGYINKKLEYILKSASALFFKEINSILNLLSRGEKFNIFQDYNTFNYNEINRMFREYEKDINKARTNDKKLFNTIFICYTTLLKVFNKLCLINSIDIKRKQTINPITNILTETINILKFTTKLSQEHLNRLNNILGQILYYFSHLPFVDSKGKDVNYLIEEYYLLFEKICDGYTVSKDSEFMDNLSSKEEEYLRFRNNSSYLLLIMLKKLTHSYKSDEFFITDSFKRCMLLYEKNFSFSFLKNNKITIQSFREDLLNSLALTYETQNKHIGEIKEYKVALSDFIIEDVNYNIHNLVTIHDILLLSENLNEDFYTNIALTLVNSPAIKNDFYEYYKLKTLDIILNHLIENATTKDNKIYVNKILKYVEKYKLASHLMTMYSKLYLSISSFLAKLGDNESIKEARDIYSTFIHINGFELLKNEYKYINSNLLIEFGKYQFKELNFEIKNYSPNELKNLGQSSIVNYLKYRELHIKYNINNSLSQITNDILTLSNLNYEKLNTSICNLISSEIFYGIAETSILGLTRKSSSIVDEGYKKYETQIDANYTLQFIFPAIYENNFKYILKESKEFVLNNLKNILSTYSQESQTFINQDTGLENIQKLKIDLDEYEFKDATFIMIYIKSLNEINNNYGFDIGKKYLNTIINKISTIISNEDRIYYLNNGLLSILLNNKDSINNIVEKIFKFKIKKNGEELNIDFILSVVISRKNLYEKAIETLNKAIISKKNLLFYEQ